MKTLIRSLAHALLGGAALLLAALPARAAGAKTPEPEPGALCKAPEYRALDYTIGRFRVVAETGEAAGELVVTPMLQGCALRGLWRGAIAGQGEATTWYDRHARLWRRVFVNDDGHSLQFSGRIEQGRLVLTGRNAFFDGREGLQRMTWRPLPDGSIEQRWEMSMDAGVSWQVLLASRALRQP